MHVRGRCRAEADYSFWEAALGWRRTFDEDDQVCIEPPKGSPEDGVAPDILFLKVPEGN